MNTLASVTKRSVADAQAEQLSLYHGSTPWMFFSRLAVLVPMGYGAWRKRNVYIGMIAHCLLNLISLTVLFAQPLGQTSALRSLAGSASRYDGKFSSFGFEQRGTTRLQHNRQIHRSEDAGTAHSRIALAMVR